MKKKKSIYDTSPTLEVEWMRRSRQVRFEIFKIQSIPQLQEFIRESLPTLCGVNSISIQNKIISKKSSKKSFKMNYKYQYPLKDQKDVCIIFKKSSPFETKERSFLRQIAQAIESILGKIDRAHKLQVFKRQWKSTFDAIQKPICVTDGDFNILSSNKSFLMKVKKEKLSIFRKNCFETFFNMPLTEKEEQDLLRKNIIKLSNKEKLIYEVGCQSFVKTENAGSSEIRLILFTDRTQKIEMEKKMEAMRESEEMGIITSSIAHDLSNPLSGIQVLLDLSLAEENKAQVDERIKEMLSAVKSCQQIIEQLLRPDSIQDLFQFSIEEKDKSLDSTL